MSAQDHCVIAGQNGDLLSRGHGFLATPQYEIVATSGPGHRRDYVSEVIFKGQVHGTGRGKTKRAAEQLAAREALESLGELQQPARTADDQVLEAVAAHERG